MSGLDGSEWAETVGCWSPIAIAGNHDFSSPPPFCHPSSSQWPGGRCRHHGDGLWMMRVEIRLFRCCHDLRCLWIFFFLSCLSCHVTPRSWRRTHLIVTQFGETEETDFSFNPTWPLKGGKGLISQNILKYFQIKRYLKHQNDFWKMGKGWWMRRWVSEGSFPQGRKRPTGRWQRDDNVYKSGFADGDGNGVDDGDGDGDISRKWFFPKGRQWVRCWLAEMVFPILLSGSSPSSSSSSSSPPISTTPSYSLLCRSLPYALPPVGDLRWSRPLPAPIPGWEGTRNAR